MGEQHHDRFRVKTVVCERHRSLGEAQAVLKANAEENPAVNTHGVLWTTTREE